MGEVRLLGRDGLLAEVARALAEPSSRIVTLWGPGGIGKTSVARATLARVEGHYTLAAWVPLARARTRREVLEAIARAAGFSVARAKSERAALEQLALRLDESASALLVLDNAEHVIDVVADVSRELSRAARLTLLVTSREPLSVAGERVVPIGPLRLPSPGDDPRASDAVQLLLDRAADAHGRALEAPADVLVELVARTSGVPLAIELCAARLDLLTPEELLARLPSTPSLLKTGRRDVDERHRSLAACIDESVTSLGSGPRAVLASLRAFGPRFDVRLAEAIEPERDVLDDLSTLVRKSLVMRSDGAHGVELSLLVPVRDFLLERHALDDALVLRHARAVVSRAEQVASRVGRRDGRAALQELSFLSHDLGLVVDRLAEHPSRELGDLASRALFSLRPLAAVQGPTSLVAELSETLLTEGSCLDDFTRARVRSTLGDALRDVSSFAEGRAALELALPSLRDLAGDDATRQSALAEGLFALGRIATEQADFEQALRSLTACVELSERVGARVLRGLAMSVRGSASHRLGALDDARRDYDEASRVLSDADDVHGRAWNEMRLGFFTYDMGAPAEALALLAQAREALASVGDRRLEGYARGFEGNAHRAVERYDAAAAAYRDAIGTMREVGDVLYEAVFEMDAGIALLASGDAQGALTAFGRARLREEVYQSSLLDGYEAVAWAFVGEHERARAIVERALSLTSPSVARECLAVHAQTVAALGARAELGQAPVDTAAPRTEHERIARRLRARATLLRDPPAHALLVSGDRVRPPSATWTDLTARPALAGLVRVLASSRCTRPGGVVTHEELIAAAWPGERISRDAAMNRLRVALSELRKLGFGDSIAREAGGYLIRAEVMVIMGDFVAQPCA
jgi:predicted ATPase